MRTIKAAVRDSNPNDLKPRLDLYFPPHVAERHRWQHKQPIELILDEGPAWEGTVGIKPANEPYLHRRWRRPGEHISLCDWLLDRGLAHNARVELLEESPERFRWNGILDPGRWPAGGSPEERVSRPAASASAPLIHRTRGPRPERRQQRDERPFPISDRDAVLELAELYWSLIKPHEYEIEKRLEKEMPTYRHQAFLDRPIFLAIASWKSPRPKRHHEKNTEDAIEAATARAFRASSDAAAIGALSGLAGVGLRTATALLHWMRPERFPILDVRVVAALQEDQPSNWEDVAFYNYIAERCRGVARELRLDLRRVDRAMWAWDKLRDSAR